MSNNLHKKDKIYKPKGNLIYDQRLNILHNYLNTDLRVSVQFFIMFSSFSYSSILHMPAT